MLKEFTIYKKDGRFTNTKLWKQYLDSLPDGTYFTKEFEHKKKRSHPQNAYYWSVSVELVYQGLRAAGFDAVRNKDDAHEILKSLFLKVKEEREGLRIERVKSTTELKTVEFMEYLQHISIWAFDYLGVTIPEPNQQIEMYD